MLTKGSNFPLLFRKYRFDLLLLAGALICFGLYTRNSTHLHEFVGKAPPLATLLEGTAMRKEAGALELRPAPQGTEFYAMDVLWVPEKSQARLLMINSAQVLLDEKTLVILKRPFRNGDIIQPPMKVISGRASVMNGNSKGATLERANRLVEIPDSHPLKVEKNETPLASLIKPASGGTLFYPAPEQEPRVRFSWPKPVQGFLAITLQSTNSATNSALRVFYRKISDQTSMTVPLPIQNAYTWQVLGENGKTILYGPFPFDLRLFDPVEVKKALLSGGAAKIEVIMKE